LRIHVGHSIILPGRILIQVSGAGLLACEQVSIGLALLQMQQASEFSLCITSNDSRAMKGDDVVSETQSGDGVD
jgi:hypothetical protein